MQDDTSLLKGFVEQKSESDFAQLVERHLGMVFATALRRVGGDAHLAQDVAQSVFIDLARKAPALVHVRVLGGWLHTCTVYAAAKAVRAEQRRRRREELAHAMHANESDSSPADRAWSRVQPVLDEALQSLSSRDRDAIVLRFFSARAYAEIGAAWRISENAARMRVERALDRLRSQLVRRGVTSTAGALGAALSAHAAAPLAPAALVTSISTTALTGAAGAGLLSSTLNLIAMTKTQLVLAATVSGVALSTAALQLHEQAALRQQLQAAPAVAAGIQQARQELASLEQSTAEYRALQASVRELQEVRAARTDLQTRQARLTANHTPSPATPAAGTKPEPAVDEFPRPLHRVAVQYPEALRKAGVPGEVLLAFIVDSDGRVRDPEVLETTHPDLVAPALESVVQWEFSAGRKGGRNVNTRVQMPVVYALEDPNWF